MNKQIFCFLLILFPITCLAQTTSSYPALVKAALKKAGSNRPELEKVIQYCRQSRDPLKLKAINFLLANMDIHYSADYYWADKNGKKITYNEFDYPDYEASQVAFRKIRNTPGNHMVPVQVWDLNNIKASFLIQNIKSAFNSWHAGWAKNIPFADFCEYILPYRASIEPLQDWHSRYQTKYKWFSDSVKREGIQPSLYALAVDNKKWFSTTYDIEQREEPLPRLGALQLLFRKKGPCEDIADLQVFALRSQGVPVSLNIVPFWATSTGAHFINTVFDPNMKAIQYDESRPNPLLNRTLAREPSKVIRMTYARQPSTLASFEDAPNIPSGFMRYVNYLDITDQYWETTNIDCKLFPSSGVHKIAYACIFNGMEWRPTWWGKVKNDAVTFSAMSRGVVYLPVFYADGKTQAAGYPLAVGYHHEQALIPNLNKKISIQLKEQDKYLMFRPGEKYKLFYWDNKWKLVGIQLAGYNMHTMLFSNVPANCLYLLVAGKSNRKERPFTITDEGQRNWF